MGRVCRIAGGAMKQAVRYIHFYRRPYRNVHYFFLSCIVCSVINGRKKNETIYQYFHGGCRRFNSDDVRYADDGFRGI